MPTEEVFTTPDARRTEGVVHPAAAAGGERASSRASEARFDGGSHRRRPGAKEGADVVRGQLSVDEGAAPLGEVALVDGVLGSARRASPSSKGCSTRTLPATSPMATRYAEAVDGGQIDGVNVSSCTPTS